MATSSPRRSVLVQSNWKRAVRHVSTVRSMVLGGSADIEPAKYLADERAPRRRASTILEVADDPDAVSPDSPEIAATVALGGHTSFQPPSPGSRRWKKAAKALSVTRLFATATTSPDGKDTEDVPRPLTAHEEASLRDLFDAFNQAKLQYITVGDFRVILQTFLNRQLSREEMTSLVTTVGVQPNQTIAYENYKATMAAAVHTYYNTNANDPITVWVRVGAAIVKMVENRRIGVQSPGGGALMGGGGAHGNSAYSLLFAVNDSEAKKSEQHAAMIDHFKMRRLSIIPATSSHSNANGSSNKQVDVDAEGDGPENNNGTADQSSETRHGWSGPWSPDCWPKKALDLLIMAIVLFQALYIPFVTSFQPPLSLAWVVLDLVFDSIFLFDVCITFNIMFKLSPTQPWVKDRWAIARAYIKGWFSVDVVASIPFDLIIEGALGSDANSASGTAVLGLFKAMRLPRLLRLLKILRILRFSKFMQLHPELLWWLQYSKHANLLRVLKMILMICVVLHYLACMFYAAASNGNWMGMEYCDWHWGHRDYVTIACSDASYLSRYIAAYYYAMVLNQGEDIGPSTPNEKIYATFSILGGSILLAIVFGHIGILITNLSASSSAYHGKMEKLFNIMQHLELPGPLRTRIVRYYELIWSRYRSLNGQIRMFVPELNSSLRAEVYVYMRTNLILSVPFLRNCSPDVVKELVVRLKEQVHLQGDYIVHKGNVASEMFCVSHGFCEITNFVHEAASAPDPPAPQSRGGGLLHVKEDFVANKAGNPTNKPKRPALRSSLSSVLAERDIVQPRDSEQVLKVILEGDYFADIALIEECKSNCNMRSATFVELCILTREDFVDVLSQEAYIEERKFMEELILSKHRDDLHGDWAFHTPLTKRKTSVFEKRRNPWGEMQSQMKRIEVLAHALLAQQEDTTTTEQNKDVGLSFRPSSAETRSSHQNSSSSSSSMMMPRLSENTPTGRLLAKKAGGRIPRDTPPMGEELGDSDADEDEATF